MTAGAIARLKAWNEGDTEALPAGYDHDLLDWQRDPRALLASHAVVSEALERIQDQRPPNGWSAGNIARKALADANEGS